MELFQKVMTHKLCQNANFENGGITIQIDLEFKITLRPIFSSTTEWCPYQDSSPIQPKMVNLNAGGHKQSLRYNM